MFQEIPVNEKNIYAFKATGKLTKKDYDEFLPRLQTLIHKYGALSLFIELEDFRGWEPKAGWEDMKWGMEHDEDFDRIAIVGENRWMKFMVALADLFTEADIRYFKRDEAQQAWDWLRKVGESESAKQAEPGEALPPVQIQPYEHIVAALDFSRHSDATLQRAIELAKHYNAKLSLIHAVEHILFEYADADMIIPPADFLEEDQAIFDSAKAQLEKIAHRTDYARLQNKVLWGSPKSTILNYAEAQNADLIVIGSHGHKGIARLMGSTATGVVNSARCDVVVVKLPE